MGLIFGFEVGGGGELFLKLHKVNESLNMWHQTCHCFDGLERFFF